MRRCLQWLELGDENKSRRRDEVRSIHTCRARVEIPQGLVKLKARAHEIIKGMHENCETGFPSWYFLQPLTVTCFTAIEVSFFQWKLVSLVSATFSSLICMSSSDSNLSWMQSSCAAVKIHLLYNFLLSFRPLPVAFCPLLGVLFDRLQTQAH